MDSDLKHPSQITPERRVSEWIVPAPVVLEIGFYAVPAAKSRKWLPIKRDAIRQDRHFAGHIVPRPPVKHFRALDPDEEPETEYVLLTEAEALERALAAPFRMRCGYVLEVYLDMDNNKEVFAGLFARPRRNVRLTGRTRPPEYLPKKKCL